MSDREIDFEDLVDCEYDFYGCEGQCFKLDGVVYEAIEDNAEGEVGLDRVEISDAQMIYVHALPIARVVVEEDDIGIYALNDLHDNHCWLRFGTEYRCDDVGRVVSHGFVFEYTPKSSINTDGQ